jgi:hypothetical protein
MEFLKTTCRTIFYMMTAILNGAGEVLMIEGARKSPNVTFMIGIFFTG